MLVHKCGEPVNHSIVVDNCLFNSPLFHDAPPPPGLQRSDSSPVLGTDDLASDTAEGEDSAADTSEGDDERPDGPPGAMAGPGPAYPPVERALFEAPDQYFLGPGPQAAAGWPCAPAQGPLDAPDAAWARPRTAGMAGTVGPSPRRPGTGPPSTAQCGVVAATVALAAAAAAAGAAAPQPRPAPVCRSKSPRSKSPRSKSPRSKSPPRPHAPVAYRPPPDRDPGSAAGPADPKRRKSVPGKPAKLRAKSPTRRPPKPKTPTSSPSSARPASPKSDAAHPTPPPTPPPHDTPASKPSGRPPTALPKSTSPKSPVTAPTPGPVPKSVWAPDHGPSANAAKGPGPAAPLQRVASAPTKPSKPPTGPSAKPGAEAEAERRPKATNRPPSGRAAEDAAGKTRDKTRGPGSARQDPAFKDLAARSRSFMRHLRKVPPTVDRASLRGAFADPAVPANKDAIVIGCVHIPRKLLEPPPDTDVAFEDY